MGHEFVELFEGRGLIDEVSKHWWAAKGKWTYRSALSCAEDAAVGVVVGRVTT